MQDKDVVLTTIVAAVVSLVGPVTISLLWDLMINTSAWWVGVFSGIAIFFIAIPTLVCVALLIVTVISFVADMF